MRLKTLTYTTILSMLALWACKDEIINPFDDRKNDPPAQSAAELNMEEGSFSYIHYKVFEPTCANSGCHDGTFEPNFNSIESAYNTLVYHDIIKNDQLGTYTYRVQPGAAHLSLLVERLSGQMDGVEDQMPIILEPGSDYDQNRAAYIQMIKDWIDAGANDMFGDAPVIGNQIPRILGAIAFADGGTVALERTNAASPIRVPVSTSTLDIWIAISDDSTNTSDIAYNKIKFSNSINSGFPAAQEKSMTIESNPLQAIGYFGNTVSYFHHIQLNPASVASNIGDQAYFRILIDDTDNGVVEIPTNGSFGYFKEYLSFKMVQ